MRTSFLDVFRLNNDRLPTEYPFRKALRIYGRQLGVFLKTTGISLIVFFLVLLWLGINPPANSTGSIWLWRLIILLLVVTSSGLTFFLVRYHSNKSTEATKASDSEDDLAIRILSLVEEQDSDSSISSNSPLHSNASLPFYKVSGKIADLVREHRQVSVEATGSMAIYQVVKSLDLAQQYLKIDDIEISAYVAKIDTTSVRITVFRIDDADNLNDIETVKLILNDLDGEKVTQLAA